MHHHVIINLVMLLPSPGEARCIESAALPHHGQGLPGMADVATTEETRKSSVPADSWIEELAMGLWVHGLCDYPCGIPMSPWPCPSRSQARKPK